MRDYVAFTWFPGKPRESSELWAVRCLLMPTQVQVGGQGSRRNATSPVPALLIEDPGHDRPSIVELSAVPLPVSPLVPEVRIADGVILGRPDLVLIAGPCVIESADHVVGIAREIAAIAKRVGVPYIFKASFDKANRTSLKSYRGPGLKAGLAALARVRDEVKVPILTDIHEHEQAAPAAEVADILQIPAFLSRQTDLIVAAAKTGRVVNLKKGQFLAPWEMTSVVDKARATGNDALLVCERGVSFGYNNLVVDMRSLAILRATRCPVVFDATHAVQQPGALGGASGGEREHVPVLARAAVAAGIAGLFMETHPDPDSALCDGPTAWPLARVAVLLEQLVAIDAVVKARPYLEDQAPENESQRVH